MNLALKLLRGICNRRLAMALSWVLLLLFVAVGINLVAIRLLGSVDDWTRWLNQHRPHLFLWRLCLYGATAYGWWWMRERVRRREPESDARVRLRRAEVAAVLAVLTLEGTIFVQNS